MTTETAVPMVDTVKAGHTIDQLLDFYASNKFDLLQIYKPTNTKYDKIPLEQDWSNKQHTDRKEWENWLKEGYNLGLKTGKCSNITVIDCDTKKLPPDLLKLIDLTQILVQYTARGMHLIFQYEESIKQTQIPDLKLDIRNDGGQIVVAPSMVSGRTRAFSKLIPPTKMSKELLDYCVSKFGSKKTPELPVTTSINVASTTDQVVKDFKFENINTLDDGQRHIAMMHIGGILRKELNTSQTIYVLDYINKKFLNPPLDDKDFRDTIVSQMDKYIELDTSSLASRVLNYLKLANEATNRDVKEALVEKKMDVDKALAWLVNEGMVVKSRGVFHPIKKVEWFPNKYPEHVEEVPFKFPYFHDIAKIEYGDLLLLGSASGHGKTHIAMNMVKSLVDQKIRPYYIFTEAKSRWDQIQKDLKIPEDAYNCSFSTDPSRLELENNAVTIIDWLCIEDFTTTEVVMKRFVEKLFKTKGLLVVIMQLKPESKSWFAPNLVMNYPSLASRYLYEDETGIGGYWQVDKIRDPKVKGKFFKIPCQYDWETKILSRVCDIAVNTNNLPVEPVATDTSEPVLKEVHLEE